ncbi:hypothetical protein INS49_011385 [Diaporthe citri]|uniref:uncharacterized protein n=1 Tax=Diaporthe citri TaxID=83186 RepID=UPI001C7F16B5|nr:uncharacterized protein INS49_011385 [Diaporthe citri]KAG6360328.1 hypothetical protein INS49_011385 [Diaporthe citri]
MSVDAQGPPNDQDGCAPPTDKSAEHEAAEHGEAQHDVTTHDAPTAEIEEVPPPKPQPKLCGICEKQEGKYKCPRCSISYCSVACFRPHKENHPPVEPQPAQAPSKPTQQDTNDDSRPNKRKAHPFNILDDSPELAQLFKRYPSLPTKLTNIHVATLPPEEEQPGRGGLPWNLQQAPGYQHKKPRWTHDLGLRRGKEALRKARTDPGEDGDAVREYCELVLHLLSKQEATGAVTDLVREQVIKQDVQLIEKLIEAESKWT